MADESTPRSDTNRPKPDFELPDDFDTERGFLAFARKEFYDDIQFDRLNREAALEDLRFAVGDQWDEIVRQRREALRKPVLTVNRIPAFMAQIIGVRRMNETMIKVVPDNGGTIQVARVREGLLRNIQKVSHAEAAYDKALEGTVACGIGNFRINIDYSPDDVWNQELGIVPVNDHLSVVWDRMLTEPTGRDAGHVFIVDVLKKSDFQRQYPWASAADMIVDATLRGDLRMNGWISIDDVRVASFWRMRTRLRTYALMTDGATCDITEVDDPQVLANIQQDSKGRPIVREDVEQKYAEMYVISGLDILAGPYRLPISRVPVFRVPGWEVNIGEWRHRWGLVRFLKDPQRLHNYWRSVWAEKMMQTPRQVWMAADTAVQGREKQFRESHVSDDPLLIWNAESGAKPERVPPAQIESALMQQAEMTTQDLKDVSNIHEANLGMPSNEVSGAAIMARQRVSDTGSIIYHDNLTRAIEQCGLVCDELIPFIYDAPRVIKVLGDDAKQDLQVINNMSDPLSVDITLGKYSVSVTTGPNTVTRRVEAGEAMMNFINAAPQVAPLIMDILVKAQDWPMAEEIARRIQLMLPPGLLDPKDMTPDQQQQAQAQQQDAAQQKDFSLRMAVQTFLKTQSETALNLARAKNFSTQADAVAPKLTTEAMTAASQAEERELKGHLEAIKTATGA